MSLLNDLVEVLVAELPGQDMSAPSAIVAPARLPNLAGNTNSGVSELHLQAWRKDLTDEIRTRAIACLTETFDRKNSYGGRSASPALRAARNDFIARVENASYACLLEQLKWSLPELTKHVFDAFTDVSNKFADPPVAVAHPPRRSGCRSA